MKKEKVYSQISGLYFSPGVPGRKQTKGSFHQNGAHSAAAVQKSQVVERDVCVVFHAEYNME